MRDATQDKKCCYAEVIEDFLTRISKRIKIKKLDMRAQRRRGTFLGC